MLPAEERREHWQSLSAGQRLSVSSLYQRINGMPGWYDIILNLSEDQYQSLLIQAGLESLVIGE